MEARGSYRNKDSGKQEILIVDWCFIEYQTLVDYSMLDLFYIFTNCKRILCQ